MRVKTGEPRDLLSERLCAFFISLSTIGVPLCALLWKRKKKVTGQRWSVFTSKRCTTSWIQHIAEHIPAVSVKKTFHLKL